MTRNKRFLGLLTGFFVLGCGSPVPPFTLPDAFIGSADGGVDANAAPVDGGRDAAMRDTGPSACASPRAVTLTAGMQTIMGNTTGMTSTLARLDGCAGMGTAPGTVGREIVAVTLPGTATDIVGVTLDMRATGTSPMFDTIIEIRPAGCESVMNAVCLDDADAANQEYRSAGNFQAAGGSTVYLVVGGYLRPVMGFVNSGAWAMQVNVYLNPMPPTFTSGVAGLYDGDHLVASIMAADSAGAAAGITYTFLDMAGTPIGFDLDMDPATADVTDIDANFVPSVAGMMTFTGEIAVNGFVDFPQALMGRQLRVVVRNAFDQMSAPAMIPLAQGTTVGLGAVCDATHRCFAPLTCMTGMCAPTPEVATACSGASALTIATPTTGTTMVTTTAMLDTSMGLFEGSCVGRGAGGDEALFTVTVPAGDFDLIVDTNGAMLGMTDTIVYDRTACADPSVETGCNDDDMRMAATMPPLRASYVEIRDAAPGDHTIVVDSFGTLTAAATVDLTVSLRPVRASGAACDLLGVMDRCATGACMDGTRVCP